MVWYAGIPSETSFFLRRLESSWSGVFTIVVVLCWLLPFLVLLVPGAKLVRSLMVALAGSVFLGCWMDTYLLVFPAREEFGLLCLALDLAPTLLILEILNGRWSSNQGRSSARPYEKTLESAGG